MSPARSLAREAWISLRHAVALRLVWWGMRILPWECGAAALLRAFVAWSEAEAARVRPEIEAIAARRGWPRPGQGDGRRTTEDGRSTPSSVLRPPSSGPRHGQRPGRT